MISNPTHRVIITLTSKGEEPGVNVRVEWDPLMTNSEVEDLGYTPAAYRLAENFIFSIEDVMLPATLLEVAEGDLDSDRTVN